MKDESGQKHRGRAAIWVHPSSFILHPSEGRDGIMHRPRFSVVIPTRERAETLRHSLRTCAEQDFDDYEVVVCDNSSSPATRQVVQECGCAKVRYVRSDRPLAMSDNWDLALSH